MTQHLNPYHDMLFDEDIAELTVQDHSHITMKEPYKHVDDFDILWNLPEPFDYYYLAVMNDRSRWGVFSLAGTTITLKHIQPRPDGKYNLTRSNGKGKQYKTLHQMIRMINNGNNDLDLDETNSISPSDLLPTLDRFYVSNSENIENIHDMSRVNKDRIISLHETRILVAKWNKILNQELVRG